jgi:hypothetical protein
MVRWSLRGFTRWALSYVPALLPGRGKRNLDPFSQSALLDVPQRKAEPGVGM